MASVRRGLATAPRRRITRQKLPGVATEGNRVRRALADRRAHRILEFRWHFTDQHDGVAIVVQFEHPGAEPQADAETGAYLPVDMNFHCELADTGSNSRLM